MTGSGSRTTDGAGDPRHIVLDHLLAVVHDQLGVAVNDRINAQGGPPELRNPDLALDRLLAATHGKGVAPSPAGRLPLPRPVRWPLLGAGAQNAAFRRERSGTSA